MFHSRDKDVPLGILVADPLLSAGRAGDSPLGSESAFVVSRGV